MTTQQRSAAFTDDIDRRLIGATQHGLPLTPDPYGDVARELGLPVKAVMERLEQMLARGVIRRIGVIPNHYRLGFTANGMSVWDIDDAFVDDMGAAVGALGYVSHCYKRPRCLPLWPFNLFAMVHGRDRGEVEEKVAAIKAIVGTHSRSNDILYSTKILKKTGLRISDRKDIQCSG